MFLSCARAVLSFMVCSFCQLNPWRHTLEDDFVMVQGTRQAQESVKKLQYVDPGDFFLENNEIGLESEPQVRNELEEIWFWSFFGFFLNFLLTDVSVDDWYFVVFGGNVNKYTEM